MKKHQVIIRLMKKKDLKELAKAYTRAYSIYNKWEHWNDERSYALLSYWHKRQPDLAFVAELDKKVVGAFVAGIKPWWDGNHLVDGELVVDPDYQKKGIGTLLLKKVLEKSLSKYNANEWEATTFKKTKFPLSWYTRLGFKEHKEWTIIGGNIKEALKKM
ncbi:MAG: GNAT family N-acetyltransferase [Candidatus Aenigmarchaeota archaeon]|nr:GNAT family N-acetyltransferase [Candidatus Aenigmarchaeota archaeon]